MRRQLAILIVLPAILSCGQVLEPDDLAGVFALQAVPVVLHPGNGSLEILADTFRVSTDGSATRSLTISFQSEDASFMDSRVEGYRYRIRGGTVEFELVCPPNALMLCTPPPHLWGTPNSAGLSLRAAVDPQVGLEYERVAWPMMH